MVSLDITLVKEAAGTWPHLLADLDEERRLGVCYDDSTISASGDTNGAATNAADEPLQSCFNVEQLEDVDMVNGPDDDSDAIIQRIDGETLQATQRVRLTYIYLILSVLICPSL